MCVTRTLECIKSTSANNDDDMKYHHPKSQPHCWKGCGVETGLEPQILELSDPPTNLAARNMPIKPQEVRIKPTAIPARVFASESPSKGGAVARDAPPNTGTRSPFYGLSERIVAKENAAEVTVHLCVALRLTAPPRIVT